MTPCTHESRTVPKSVTNQVEAVTRSTSPLKKESSIITELLAETQNQSRLISNVLQEANPDLNMSVFMKQNNRFTGRQGPIIWLNQTVIKLVTWHSTTNTLIFLLCYIIICLHPIIISILPQITILCLMMKFYHRRADQIMNNKSITKPHEIGTPPKVSPSAAELKAALQNIQNTMGQVSDLYDAGYNVYRMIDWTNPELTQDILWKVLVSIVGTLAVVYIIPINYIALVGGVGIFVANTAIFKAASLTLAPIIAQKLQKRIHVVRDLINESKKSGNPAVIEIILFENQRWWAGAGWVPVLLQHERKPWSDITGSIQYESKDTFATPTICELTDQSPSESPKGTVDWVEPDWELDMKFNEVDVDGWEYSNNKWENPRSTRILGSFTRRRKWARHLSFVEKRD
jgi:hypothetical protein